MGSIRNMFLEREQICQLCYDVSAKFPLCHFTPQLCFACSLITAHKKNVLSQFSFSEKVCSIHSVHKYMHTYTHCITHTCKVMVPPDNGFALEPVFEMSLLLARRSLAANTANWPNLSPSFISDGQLNYHRYTPSSALSLS